jgi:hypothetical protein
MPFLYYSVSGNAFRTPARRDFVAKKLHVELTPANWDRIKEYIELYNADPKRITPRFKPSDVINRALYEFLRDKKDWGDSTNG